MWIIQRISSGSLKIDKINCRKLYKFRMSLRQTLWGKICQIILCPQTVRACLSRRTSKRVFFGNVFHDNAHASRKAKASRSDDFGHISFSEERLFINYISQAQNPLPGISPELVAGMRPMWNHYHLSMSSFSSRPTLSLNAWIITKIIN